MTKYVTRCLVGNTKVDLPTPGRNPQRAVWNAQKTRYGMRASAFIVYERKTMNVVFVTVQR